MIQTDVTFDFIYCKTDPYVRTDPYVVQHMATLCSYGNEWNKFLRTIKTNQCELIYPNEIICRVDCALHDDELKTLIKFLRYIKPHGWENILDLCEICAADENCTVKIYAVYNKE